MDPRLTRVRLVQLYSEALSDRITVHNLATFVKLPTGAVELAANTEHLVDKIGYILNAYDTEMRLRTNPNVQMVDFMVYVTTNESPAPTPVPDGE